METMAEGLEGEDGQGSLGLVIRSQVRFQPVKTGSGVAVNA